MSGILNLYYAPLDGHSLRLCSKQGEHIYLLVNEEGMLQLFVLWMSNGTVQLVK